jgi:hypothetical protein
VEWLHCRVSDDRVFEFYSHDSLSAPIDLRKDYFDKPNLAGIIVVGSSAFFDSIKDLWLSAYPAVPLPFYHVSDAETESILEASLRCMAEGRLQDREHAGNISLQLAEYRSEFDRLQHSFARLEQHVQLHPPQRMVPIFEYLPNYDLAGNEQRKELETVDILPGAPLRQYLPVDSFGFSVFAICIGAFP